MEEKIVVGALERPFEQTTDTLSHSPSLPLLLRLGYIGKKTISQKKETEIKSGRKKRKQEEEEEKVVRRVTKKNAI